jgi:hypothetical protein
MNKWIILLCLLVFLVFLIAPELSSSNWYWSSVLIVIVFFGIVIGCVILLSFYGVSLLNLLIKNMKKIYHWIKENKKISLYVFIGLVLFFWFAIRPAIIKSNCANSYNYQRCIHSYGL